MPKNYQGWSANVNLISFYFAGRVLLLTNPDHLCVWPLNHLFGAPLDLSLNRLRTNDFRL